MQQDSCTANFWQHGTCRCHEATGDTALGMLSPGPAAACLPCRVVGGLDILGLMEKVRVDAEDRPLQEISIKGEGSVWRCPGVCAAPPSVWCSGSCGMLLTCMARHLALAAELRGSWRGQGRVAVLPWSC